ncbi:TetR/AcrR family transcriptional regulator [Companilactobacillus versmoldensis]|nr:TetR/AcrR family transcriptional regulator [Companilactobacillus versmoldensis]
MVSTTFNNLNPAKKAKISQALLTEFSSHPLPDSQVSRIIKTAGIARGAFYKYFDDLQDAYRYTYQRAIKYIHSGPVDETSEMLTAEQYLKQVTDFVEAVDDSQYCGLLKMHITKNENLLRNWNEDNQQAESLMNQEPLIWANAVLAHETIKLVLLNPSEKKSLLDRYFQAIQKLTKKEL